MQQSVTLNEYQVRSAQRRDEGYGSSVPEPFSFTGSGSEYFRIWIVNLLLTIATLGIYSAWAKVRRLRYFYEHTRVADANFDYHGRPLAILQGRVVAVLLIVGYNFAVPASSTLGLVMLAAAAALVPWLLWKSLQFTLFNSSYRGIRFGFRGDLSQVYTVFLMWPIATLFTGYLLAPLAHQRLKQFQHTESRFGTTYFRFSGSVSSFYKVYLIGLLLALGGLVAIALLLGGALSVMLEAASTGPGLEFGGALLLIFTAYLWMIVLFPIVTTMIQKLVWNNTTLGAHRFVSTMTWGRVVWIAVTNMIGIAVTLGFFLPFAQVRMMRYRIESLSLLRTGSLDDFIATTGRDVTAAGEGAADLLDFDIAL
jgi:uncharacterized membrane protein YjgN (DUF898 family)